MLNGEMKMIRCIQRVVVSMMFAALLVPCTAKSNTYNITAPPASSGVSSFDFDFCTSVECENVYSTPFYVFKPGDTINFGSVSVGAFYLHDQYGDLDLDGGAVGVSYNKSSGVQFVQGPTQIGVCNIFYSSPGCFTELQNLLPSSVVVSLLFTLPPGATGIQVAWTAPYSYFAPTPLPAALPLFATGLGVMGLLGWHRKRKNNAAIAAA
jgi:hypothetical protein